MPDYTRSSDYIVRAPRPTVYLVAPGRALELKGTRFAPGSEVRARDVGGARKLQALVARGLVVDARRR